MQNVSLVKNPQRTITWLLSIFFSFRFKIYNLTILVLPLSSTLFPAAAIFGEKAQIKLLFAAEKRSINDVLTRRVSESADFRQGQMPYLAMLK